MDFDGKEAVIRCAGGIGKVTAGAMRQSALLAGVRPGVVGLPTTAADFVAPASIAAVMLTGKTAAGGFAFVESTIAASELGRIGPGLVESLVTAPGPGGAPSFGLAATFLRS